MEKIYKILDLPVIYRFVGRILVPGGGKNISRFIQARLQHISAGEKILDVGCGPYSRLTQAGLLPIGLDLAYSYIAAYNCNNTPGVVASAKEIPFTENCFDSVWSIGMFHHLSGEIARSAMREMVRVCKQGGHVIIMDNVFPKHVWRHPIAALVRKMDRGRFVRSQSSFEMLLPEGSRWKIERVVYSYIGAELLICQFDK